MWGSQDRMDVWAMPSMMVLSMAVMVPFLWYHKRATEALETIAECEQEKTG
jgi:hypothetical protein